MEKGGRGGGEQKGAKKKHQKTQKKVVSWFLWIDDVDLEPEKPKVEELKGIWNEWKFFALILSRFHRMRLKFVPWRKGASRVPHFLGKCVILQHIYHPTSAGHQMSYKPYLKPNKMILWKIKLCAAMAVHIG